MFLMLFHESRRDFVHSFDCGAEGFCLRNHGDLRSESWMPSV